jgi:transposase
VSDVPAVELVEQLRRANAGLRDVLTAQAAQIREFQAMVHVLGLQVAELQRRLGSGSDDSGTPSSKESIEVRTRRKAEREARQEARGGSSRQRSKDKPRGGQPGHPGHGLRRDPAQRLPVDPPAECRGCGDDLTRARLLTIF